MRKAAACLILAALTIAPSLPLHAKTHMNAQEKAAYKRAKQQKKAMQKYINQQQKEQKREVKQQRKAMKEQQKQLHPGA